MSHPTADDLLGYALEGPSASAQIAAHVRGCDVCAAEAARLQSAASLLREHTIRGATPTPACLDDDAVAALAAGDVASDERSALEKHAATCAYCRQRVASVALALADPAVAREVVAADARREPRRVRPRILVPVAAAAAAVLVLVLTPRRADDPGSQHRGVETSTATPMVPTGRVAAAETLQWATVAGADRYRVTLFDATGIVLYETQIPDTVVALPDSVVLAPGRSYLWKVEARIGWDRWVASKLIEFTIRGDRRP